MHRNPKLCPTEQLVGWGQPACMFDLRTLIKAWLFFLWPKASSLSLYIFLDAPLVSVAFTSVLRLPWDLE